jgi:hypothetical protein
MMTEADLATLTAELPERFADRVPVTDLDGLRSMARAGEWAELLDLLVAVLCRAHAPITTEEGDRLRQALTGWGMPDHVLADLDIAS